MDYVLFPIELSFFLARIHVLTAKNKKSRVMLVVSDHVTSNTSKHNVTEI